MESALNFKITWPVMYTGTIVLGEFSELQYSLSPSYQAARLLVIVETKLDATFPINQFLLEGFSKPFRLDRNRNGGGILIYVREDIPTKQLFKHNFPSDIEGIFVEINLRKTYCVLGSFVRCGTSNQIEKKKNNKGFCLVLTTHLVKQIIIILNPSPEL